MLRNLVSHLAQLWRFNGREGVAAFWTYAMFVIIGLLWAMMAAMMPVMARMMAKAGFGRVGYTNFTGGVAALHHGWAV